MNIYTFMNQKMTATLHGKKTGMIMPYLEMLKKSKLILIERV